MAKRPGPLKQARTIVGAQYAPIDYAAKQARLQTAKEQAALTASGKALVGLLQKGVGADTQMYDAAVNQQQALAQGAAQLLANANPNAQIQGDLASIGAPPEQGAGLAHSLQAQFPGQGAVLNVQQGTVPGASLIAQKAAEQGYLAGLPTVAALSGQQSLRGLLANAAKEQQGFQQQRMQVGAQLPGLVNQLTEQAYTHQQDALDRAFQQQQLRFNARQAELDRIAQSATTDYQRKQLKLAYDQLAADKLAAQPTSLDRYKARTDRINARNDRRAATTGGGLTPYEKYEVDQNRGKTFDDVRSKVQEALGLTGTSSGGSVLSGTKNSGSTFNVPKGQRNRAFNRLYSLYAGPLVRAGVSKGSIKAMLDTALNEAGYALPGKKTGARGQRVK